MNKRIEWIDMARGIAIIMIVITHSLSLYSRSFFSALLFAVNVPIFFILSGYLFKEKSFSQIVRSGFRNLLLPYFSTVFLIGIIEFFGHNIFPNWIHPINFLQYIASGLYGLGTSSFIPGLKLTITAVGAIWFLPAMFLGNLLFNFVVKVSHKFSYSNYWIFLLSVVLAVCGFLLGQRIQLPWSFDAVLISQIFYCSGYILRAYNWVEKGNYFFDVVSLLLWLLSAKSGFFYMNISHADSPFLAVIGAFGGTYFIVRLCRWGLKAKYQWPVLQKYGKDSLVMLCFHLIDLNALLVGSKIFGRILAMTNRVEFAVFAIIIYRLIIIWLASIIVPFIPFLRSFFFPRKYPFSKPQK
ncbi:O-acetyltransferase [Ligilactobacillus pabuli]|uniref:O-acetyltransferase n=1 Tax=Ligilactobacillus pabuli TaxID=2886039 RepID=A0ABQ5JGU4_9LACO|nr:acyltransferase family protein [Ligilactobacillus pabuli]GKS81294.1 O-acetyltransferase [Ligilactobacillus pabuli]